MVDHNEKLDGAVQVRNSDSDRSPSIKGTKAILDDPLGVLHSVPDPDAGVSDEERLRRVSCLYQLS